MVRQFLVASLFCLPNALIADTSIFANFVKSTDVNTSANDYKAHLNNFGLAGIIEMPSADALPEGEILLYQRNHKTLWRTGASFQLTPRLGLSFRYNGHGEGGPEAYGRINHDRSFDLHFNLLKEHKHIPAIGFGLRDFIGTGWYSSEYIVGTKSFGSLRASGGLGFGRLAGRNQRSNPFKKLDNSFSTRDTKRDANDKGGTLGNINWFQGPASLFGGFTYDLNDKTTLAAEYSPDLMIREASYYNARSPYNYSFTYRLSDTISLNANYLNGSTVGIGANIQFNPKRPPSGNGIDLAPVPMRQRAVDGGVRQETNISAIQSVLKADKFLVKGIELSNDQIRVEIENNKFRSTAQALGRLISSLQRFSGDDVKFALIVFTNEAVPLASYRVDLSTIGSLQTGVAERDEFEKAVRPHSVQSLLPKSLLEKPKFSWGLAPYLDYRLFDPRQPVRAEVGLSFAANYQISDGWALSGEVKKSLVSDFDKKIRLSDSVLPHVHSDFPLYDEAGQPGHLDHLTVNHMTKMSENSFANFNAGYLEPMYGGLSAEFLYKQPDSRLGIGFDVAAVQMRDFNMRFGMRDYKTTTGHVNLFYDAGGEFDIEANIGRYLARDWGVTTKVKRRFGNGWTVGAYATLTDVPFKTFGEGSFDKGIFLTMPMDWILGNPNPSRRTITIRPITRDGGAILGSAKTLHSKIREAQFSEVRREYGRIWK